MKDEVVQSVFFLSATVVTAAVEDLCPMFAGTGLPLLMALVMVSAPRVNVLPGVMIAVGAGAFEDALSSLPPMTSICFFTVVSLLSRKEYFPRVLLLFLYPVYALWVGMCMTSPMGDSFVGILFSLPLGAFSYFVMFLLLEWSGRKAGIDG